MCREERENSTVIPYYKQNVIENYGKVISLNKLNINDGLSYTEHNESVFKDLEMTGGDIVVNGNFLVDGRLFGSVRDIVVTDKNSFYARELAIATLRNLKIGKEAWMYSPNSFSLTVENEYQNAGILASGGNLSLYLKKIPQSRQDGLILGKGEFCYKYERNDRPINHKDAPNVTSDPTILQYLRAHEKEAKDPKFFQNPEFRRMKEDFYKRNGYAPKPDETTKDALINLGNNFAKTRKITVYIDHYLNTITYHYVTYMPSGVTVLARITETGYIFQRREMLEKEIAGHMPPAISEFLDELNQEFQSKKDNVENKLKHAKEQNKRDEQKKLEELMNVPTIKMAYNALEIANNKLIATAEKMEQISKNMKYSQHKLNIFLKNTQDELEMNKLKTEYNKVARECLVQLTKFRLSVQGWSSQHPQDAKVADWVLTGAKGGAILVAGIGIVSTIYVSVPISIPATLAGAGVISAKQMVTKFLKEKVITYAKRQGITLKEKSDFVDTAEWLISGIEHFASIKEVVKVATNPTKLIKQNFIKTYTSFDKYGDIALALRRATEVYTRTQKERLVSDVLRVFANE